MLFNYNSGIKETFLREGAYLPGQRAKSPAHTEIETINSLDTNSRIEFGTVLKREFDDTTKMPYVTQIEDSDTQFDFYGVAMRDTTSQNSIAYSADTANIISSYYKGQDVSVMREGYISVPVQFGTPSVGDPVFVRVMVSTTYPDLPIGGIEAVGTQGTVAWKGARFESGPYFALSGDTTTPTSTTPTSQCATISLSIPEYRKIVEITQAPTTTSATYGTTLGELILTGGSAEYDGEEVSGTFRMNSPRYIPNVGTETYMASFIPDDTNTYDIISNVEVVVTITEATPIIYTNPTASGPVLYGDTLSTIYLVGGSANTDGTFEWDNDTTVITESGEQNVVFYPTDVENYLDVNNIKVYVEVK